MANGSPSRFSRALQGGQNRHRGPPEGVVMLASIIEEKRKLAKLEKLEMPFLGKDVTILFAHAEAFKKIDGWTLDTGVMLVTSKE